MLTPSFRSVECRRCWTKCSRNWSTKKEAPHLPNRPSPVTSERLPLLLLRVIREIL